MCKQDNMQFLPALKGEVSLRSSMNENELIEYKLKDKKEELRLIQTMLTLRPEDTKLLDMQAQIQAELLDIEGEKSLRIASKQSALRAKEIKERDKEY